MPKSKLGCDYEIDKKRIAVKYIPLIKDLANIVVDYFYEEWVMLYDDIYFDGKRSIIRLGDWEVKDNILSKFKHYVLTKSGYSDGKEYYGKYGNKHVNDIITVDDFCNRVNSKILYILPHRYPYNYENNYIEDTFEKYSEKLVISETNKYYKFLEMKEIENERKKIELEEWKKLHPPRPPEISFVREWKNEKGEIVLKTIHNYDFANYYSL